MLRIEDENEILLTRGDTAYLTVKLDGYEPLEGDTISFTVKKAISDTEPVLKLTIPIDEAFVFQPSDTAGLPYGKYYYDIQIDTAFGEVFTVVEKSPFRLKEEVNVDGE